MANDGSGNTGTVPSGRLGPRPPARLPGPRRARSENFPVASRLLPAALRSDLMALYGWARLVDQLGDDYPGDRLAALDEVEDQLRPRSAVPANPPLEARSTPSWPGWPRQPGGWRCPPGRCSTSSRPTGRTRPFSGTKPSQISSAIAALSANPVGQTVLAMFGYATPDRLAWSDSICTGLQLVEHWQDVAEDAMVGRVYLPMDDMSRFGVTVEQLVPPPADYVDRRRPGRPAVVLPSRLGRCWPSRRLGRGKWLDEGTPLVASLKGRLRFAVAGFVAGGHAALDALAALDFDITPTPAARLRTVLWPIWPGC